MAVRARDDVTLATVTDVAYMRRFYLLQGSTLNPPAAPTANPPGGAWVTTEPSYTEGSTNSLYTVDLTMFSDNTFDYSLVSKSSAYEAAKSAYNKAVAAGNTAKDAADAVLTMAGSKTQVYYSTSVASGTTKAAGDLWRQIDGNKNVIAEWYWTGGSNPIWQSSKITDAAISNLDVGKLTANTANIVSAVAQKIAAGTADIQTVNAANLFVTGTATLKSAVVDKFFAEVVKAKMVTADAFIGKNAILTGAVTTEKLDANAINGMTVTGALVQSDAAANRGVKLNSFGLTAYDPSGVRTFQLDSATGAMNALGEFAAGDAENQVVLTRRSSAYFPNGYPGIMFPSSKYQAASYPIIQAETGVVDSSGFYSNPGGISMRAAMLGSSGSPDNTPGAGEAGTVAGLFLNADGSWQLNGGQNRPGVYGRTDGYWEIGSGTNSTPGERVRIYSQGKEVWAEQAVTAANGSQTRTQIRLTRPDPAAPPTPTTFSTAASGKRTVLSGDYVTWYNASNQPVKREGPTGTELWNGSAWVPEVLVPVTEVGTFTLGALYRAHSAWQPPVLERTGKRVHFHGTITTGQQVSFLANNAYVFGSFPAGWQPRAGGQVFQPGASSPGISSWVGAYTGGTAEFALLTGGTMGANAWIVGFDLWWDCP